MSDAKQSPIHLYTYPNSPFGAKVYWALVYKRLEFEITYVNPITTRQIAFTEQNVVPVLKICDEWMQDSQANCLRLEEAYPDYPFAGANEEDRNAIIDADQWVTDNITALHFLSCIDTRAGTVTKRNAMRMANVILPSAPGLPKFIQSAMKPFWPLMLRNAGFVKRAANMLDTTKTVDTLLDDVLRTFEARVSKTGYLAGTDDLSFADISAFAEVTFCSTYGFEGTLNADSSEVVKRWHSRIVAQLPSAPSPALFPKWPPNGFDVSSQRKSRTVI